MKLWKGFLWLFWVFLITVWIDTLIHLWNEGQTRLIVLAGFTMPCWLILFFAEGLELAVAARVKSNNPPVRDPHTFFTRRQAMVILPITYISIATVYSWLEIPFLGRVTGTAPFWFSLALVSLTTLWFAQVVPKRLAVLDPERFLAARFTSVFLRALNVIGALFDGPSADIFNLLRRLKASSNDHVNGGDCHCAICQPILYLAWSDLAIKCTCSICSAP